MEHLFEQDPLCDDDLFAADQTGRLYGALKEVWQRQVSLLSELGDRWAGAMLVVDWLDPTFMEHLAWCLVFLQFGYSPHMALHEPLVPENAWRRLLLDENFEQMVGAG